MLDVYHYFRLLKTCKVLNMSLFTDSSSFVNLLCQDPRESEPTQLSGKINDVSAIKKRILHPRAHLIFQSWHLFSS